MNHPFVKSRCFFCAAVLIKAEPALFVTRNCLVVGKRFSPGVGQERVTGQIHTKTAPVIVHLIIIKPNSSCFLIMSAGTSLPDESKSGVVNARGPYLNSEDN